MIFFFFRARLSKRCPKGVQKVSALWLVEGVGPVLRASHLPDMVLGNLQCLYLFFRPSRLLGRSCRPHFTGGETEARTGEVTCPRSQGLWGAEPGVELSSLPPQSSGLTASLCGHALQRWGSPRGYLLADLFLLLRRLRFPDRLLPSTISRLSQRGIRAWCVWGKCLPASAHYPSFRVPTPACEACGHSH